MRPSVATHLEVALIDPSATIPKTDLRDAARALSEQVRADFAPAWRVHATVAAYRAAPDFAWRIELREGIDERGAAGYHADDRQVPYAKVDISAGEWTVTASHELVEMLADPWGDRLRAGPAPPGWGGRSRRVRYLLEVADPCEALTYSTLDVPVSDFVLPSFYASSRRSQAAPYSHTGSLRRSLEVAEGGYLTFIDPATGDVWQRFVADGRIDDRNHGPQELRDQSLREWADERAHEYRAEAQPRHAPAA